MASSGSPDGGLFAGLRDQREGVQFEHALRAVAYVLREWCRFEGRTAETTGEPNDSLRAIYFDKLVGIFGRIWDELFRREGATSHVLAENPANVASRQDSLIEFPFPFQELPGLHGRGRAVTGGPRPPQFITSIVLELQEAGLCSYFHVIRGDGSSTGSEADPQNAIGENHTTIVKPDVHYTDVEEFLTSFSNREKTVLLHLSNGLRKLSPAQIRAIGTHDSPTKTLEDVEREFRYLSGHADKLLDLLKTGLDFQQQAALSCVCSDEACRKSSGNRSAYESARKCIMDEISDAKIRAIIDDVQKSSVDIWDSQAIADLRTRAKRADNFCRLLKVLARAHATLNSGSRLSDRMGGEWREAALAARTAGMSWPPLDIAALFVGSSAKVRDDLISQIELEIRQLKQKPVR